jgi:hypothetical protein
MRSHAKLLRVAPSIFVIEHSAKNLQAAALNLRNAHGEKVAELMATILQCVEAVRGDLQREHELFALVRDFAPRLEAISYQLEAELSVAR